MTLLPPHLYPHPPRPHNRDKYQIYYNILEYTRKPRKSSMIYRHEIGGYYDLKDIVGLLVECGMLGKIDGGYYKTTDKGLLYLEKVDMLHAMLDWIRVKTEF